MQINAISYYKKSSTPAFGEINPAYIGKMSERLGYVQRDVVDLKEKADASKEREELIIHQNKDILDALEIIGFMVSNTNSPSLNYHYREKLIKLSAKYSKENNG